MSLHGQTGSQNQVNSNIPFELAPKILVIGLFGKKKLFNKGLPKSQSILKAVQQIVKNWVDYVSFWEYIKW